MNYNIHIYPTRYQVIQHSRYTGDHTYEGSSLLWGGQKRKQRIESLIDDIRFHCQYNKQHDCCCSFFFKIPTQKDYLQSIIKLRLAISESKHLQTRIKYS